MQALPFDYTNAAGWFKTEDQIREVARNQYTTHIIGGSYTPLFREGNVGGVRFAVLPDGTSGNALSMPNFAIPGLKTHGRELVRIAKDAGKKFVLNGAWFQPPEAGQLIEIACEIGADAYEDNRGCPNVRDGGKQKPIPSYNIDLMKQADEHLRPFANDIEIWFKFSPYTDPEQRVAVAEYVVTSPANRVVKSNTIPNVPLRGKSGELLITTPNAKGYCGVGGTALKWLALTNAEDFRRLLPEEIGVMGVGGIGNGDDLELYRLIGCVGMQVGTACFGFEGDTPQMLDVIADQWLKQYAEAA